MKKTVLFASALFYLFTGCSDSDKGKGEYTYRTTSTCPSTWNPAEYQLGSESTVISLTSTGLYDFIMNEEKNNYKVICELASQFPQDVTENYSGKYNIPENSKTGYAWKFDIIHNATWDDKTPINASTFEYSLAQLLNPKMKNYRASSWYSGLTALVNAQEYYEGTADWNSVGFIKNDDYSFTLIFTKQLSLFQVEYGTTALILLKEDIFEANKKQTGDIIKTSYGTSADSSASYGPYKVKTFQQDKEMLLVKNPEWYGWTDGQHVDQYQTTAVSIQYITEHTTILNLFLQGKLDDTGLTPNELKIYGNSIFRKTSPQSFTWKYSFNIDREKLKSRSTSSENHIMLSYIDFRHAVSLSLNRQEIVDTVSPSSDPAFGLINHLYISDPSTNETYRSNPYASKTLCSFYGVSSPDEITGYNKTLAKEYFQKAYDKALAAGDITPSDRFYINLHTYNTSETNMRLVTTLQDAVNESSAGTSFEKRIIINQVTDDNYYSNMKNGNVDCAVTAWGGASYDPFSVTECYCTFDLLNEYGFNPEQEKLTVNINGNKVTKTYFQWHVALNEEEYSSIENSQRVAILAEIEKGLLSYYNMLPLWYSNTSILLSQRMIEGSEHYINTLVEFGGIRFRKWSMDDHDWDAWCRKNNNRLRY